MKNHNIPLPQNENLLKNLLNKKNLDKQTLLKLKNLKKNFEKVLKKQPINLKNKCFQERLTNKTTQQLKTKEKLNSKSILKKSFKKNPNKKRHQKLFKNNMQLFINKTKLRKSILKNTKERKVLKKSKDKYISHKLVSTKNRSKIKSINKKSAILMSQKIQSKIKKIFSKSREKLDQKKKNKLKFKKIKRFETEINVDNNSISTNLEKSNIISHLFSQKSIPKIENHQNQYKKNFIQRQIDVRNFQHEKFQNTLSLSQQKILMDKEKQMVVYSNYFNNQKYLNPAMRSFLLNWIQEVCSDYMFKRLTFNYAINYVDRYLQKIKNVQKEEFQLIGLVALLIAAKNEEIYTPRIENLSIAADNAYTHQQILKLERKMFKVLEYQINPPTLELWSNLLMSEWDNYYDLHKDLQKENSFKSTIYFKKSSIQSYQNFREFQQILDCCLLDIEYLKYKQVALAASVMYLIIGQKYNIFKTSQIVDTFPYISSYLLEDNQEFNRIINKFLKEKINISVYDLLPTIQYVSKYFGLMIHMDFPVAAKVQEDNQVKNHFENFLSYQTFNPYALDYVLKRIRN